MCKKITFVLLLRCVNAEYVCALLIPFNGNLHSLLSCAGIGLQDTFMRHLLRLLYLLLFVFTGLIAAAQYYPCDKDAGTETVRLYSNLRKITDRGFMFGHQDDLAYGVHWKYVTGNSDIREVTGDYPAVYGWELGHLELDSLVNLDAVPFAAMKNFIREGYARGGVITISWHFTNALTGKSAWDAVPGTVAAMLPGGAKHALYRSWLDKLAVFMHDLKGKNGEAIPVIFRPFHELNGSWFWWGKDLCTPEELKALYRFTAGYLRGDRQVHNLLYAYNTDRFSTEEEYLERYPGDEWVDIIGFDIYQRNKDNAQFIRDADKSLTILDKLAAERNKVAALTEFGYATLPDSSWWTKVLLPAIGSHKIAYALAWRNAGQSTPGRYEYYVPFKGEASAKDFKLFYDNRRTLFQKDVTKERMYR